MRAPGPPLERGGQAARAAKQRGRRRYWSARPARAPQIRDFLGLKRRARGPDARFAVRVGPLRTAYAYQAAAAGSGYTPALAACQMIKRARRCGRAKSPFSGRFAQKLEHSAGSRGTRQQDRCCGATRRSRRLHTWPQHAAPSACLLHSAHALQSLKETKMPGARTLARVA